MQWTGQGLQERIEFLFAKELFGVGLALVGRECQKDRMIF
jgi:hypothetical protein